MVGDNRKYQHISTKINKIFQQITPEMVTFSIAESWQDVTHSLTLFGSAKSSTYRIKSLIKHRFIHIL
ncbi:MAG: hypothetical protein P4L44_09630 [Oryzomonas sp.]|uniref:Y-family DNA polymerase n=1 Tax=Oryzomonas sp. TaxID=2855186 RepID=UPI002845B8E6|nr:hypothetical protein [Oryzomonas sp.]MDR3580208.1 hypothetical protein [Oryzomonas sp.]